MRGKAQRGQCFWIPASITPAHAGKSGQSIVVQWSSNGSPPRMRGKGFEPPAPRLGVWITPAHAGKSGQSIVVQWSSNGSPPRMRGKGFEPPAPRLGVWITPAHAGKRPCPQPHACPPWDHPRACGEKMRSQMYMVPTLGSPPRMRGKVHPVRIGVGLGGITPAHAGKSTLRCPAVRSLQDHPRACGEKSNSGLLGPVELGSPPRMRGKAGKDG